MGAASNWIVAIVAMLLVGIAGTVYFRGIRMRRDEARAGIVALSGMSWRVFIHMVLDALSRRGYERAVDHEEPSGDRDFVLEKDRRHWLLSCRHGSAFVLGKAVVNELASNINLKNAAGGFLVTQGRITEDAYPVAAVQRIELLDGHALWPELRGFIPVAQLSAIHDLAALHARQRTLASWLLALLVGVATFLALPAPAPEPAPAAETPAIAKDPLPATPPAPQASAHTGEPSPGQLEQQRKDVLQAIATLPDVAQATWSTESTLHITLAVLDGDAFARICPLVERYPDIAASRIQLTPPPGTDAMVRFRQCRSY